MAKFTPEEALQKLINARGNRYEYPDWEYNGTHGKIKIKCKEHGIFYQIYDKHKSGANCPHCVGGVPYDRDKFIELANIKHNFKFDYSKVVYVNSQTKVCIICPDHGEFWQRPSDHLKGKGCRQCSYDNRALRKDNEWYLKEANLKHNNFYEYPEEYKGIKVKINIKCPNHGIFRQTPDDHINGRGCPHCAHQISKPEIEIQELIKDIGYEINTNSRKVINPYELDIFIPSLNKAIEFNGLYWHYSEKLFKPGKHANKSNLCRAKGIKLLHIREDLWLKDKEKMKEVILKFINKN